MKTVLITGSNSGIGLATSIHLAKKGFFVYATMRNIIKKPNIFNNYKNIKVLQLDLTDENTMIKCIDQIIKDGGRIDVLINNAGYGLWGAFEDIEIDEIKELFETNFFGIINLTNKVLPYMRKQRSGKIINISSLNGKVVFPISGAYSASKHALEAYSEALQLEVSQFGIKVIIIEPGLFKTRFRYNVTDKTRNESSPYKNFYNYIHRKQSLPTGNSTKIIAKKIYKVIKLKNPRLRYCFGKHAKLYIFLRKLMSDRVYERLIQFIIRLNNRT